MIPGFINKDKLPHKPGIYIYKDSQGRVLYVGKAVDLYHRVTSYFSGRPDSLKTATLVEKIAVVETIVVESELEALILEANLIKKYLPIFNIRLTDDKDYLYIAITKEDFPKVITARKKDTVKVKKYFGPFPSSRTVKLTLKQLRKVFPWCSNPPKTARQPGVVNKLPTPGWKAKACFYYHLGLCSGACIGKISKEDYNKTINRFAKFLDGKKEEVLNELTQDMDKYSKNLQFEQAAQVKKTIAGIEYLLQPNRVASYLENPNFLEDQNKLALQQLQKDLNLPKLPARIEAYDISNIAGKNATGSMVVLAEGEIDKSQYRRFKIKISGKPNDYAMHQEMMGRRLSHPEWGIPQLILIDGGRGQARAACSKLQEKNLNIPVFGLAKRMEWLYPPEGDIIKLPKRSMSLRLLQKIRDESHRFAITYHRKLRNKSFLSS